MDRQCPACGHPMHPNDVVCVACRERIERRKPMRREQVLHAWGRALMLWLGVFFLGKGALATFTPAGYRSFVQSLGFVAHDDTFHYLNAAFVSIAALLYGIAWIGGYLKLHWEPLICGLALAVYVFGQGVTQFMFDPGGYSRALAFFIVWITVPVVQFVALVLGRNAVETPAEPAD